MCGDSEDPAGHDVAAEEINKHCHTGENDSEPKNYFADLFESSSIGRTDSSTRLRLCCCREREACGDRARRVAGALQTARVIGRGSWLLPIAVFLCGRLIQTPLLRLQDAPQTAKISLFGFGFRPGMQLEEVEASYRSNWLDAERVEAARALWLGIDQKVSWEDGKNLMEQEVAKRGDGKIGALTWGETSFDSLAIMLGYVQPKAGERFLDLGAGLGKVLAAAHLLCDFEECVGIELIERMATTGQGLLADFNAQCRTHEGTAELRAGDFLEADWSPYDVVFANASLFPKDLLGAIATKLDAELKTGSRIIFITNSLNVKETKRLRQINARRFDVHLIDTTARALQVPTLPQPWPEPLPTKALLQTPRGGRYACHLLSLRDQSTCRGRGGMRHTSPSWRQDQHFTEPGRALWLRCRAGCSARAAAAGPVRVAAVRTARVPQHAAVFPPAGLHIHVRQDFGRVPRPAGEPVAHE